MKKDEVGQHKIDLFKRKRGNEKRMAKLLAKDNGKLDEMKKEIQMVESIKNMQINVKDEGYSENNE